MKARSVAIAGLPGAGKTTYLAAFWHLLFSATYSTQVTFDTVSGIKTDYLDEISGRWLDGIKQKRSVNRNGPYIKLNLLDRSKLPISLTFPDLSGEIFRDMWEQRDFPFEVRDRFHDCSGLMFFLNGDNVGSSPLLSNVLSTRDKFGETEDPDQYKKWDPAFAHTQAKVVDLLQMFAKTPIDLPFRRLSLIITCWDKVDPNRTPSRYVEEKFPMLHQYLFSKLDGWDTKYFGISAQGADYEHGDDDVGPKLSTKDRKKLEKLRDLDAVERISVVSENSRSRDLSEPFVWFLD